MTTATQEKVNTETKNPRTHVAHLRFLKITPRKVRRVADTLKGLSLQEAEIQLLTRTQRASRPILKLLRSAKAGAEQQKLNMKSLHVKNVQVDKGPMLKRFLPRAMGRATPIHKTMSHVTLILEESDKDFQDRFIVTPPPKKEKKQKPEKAKASDKDTTPQSEQSKQPQRAKRASTDKGQKKGGGILKKFFRRKST